MSNSQSKSLPERLITSSEGNTQFANTIIDTEARNKLLGEFYNLQQQLLEEAAEARRSGEDAEWISSEHIPGFLFKESEDAEGISVNPQVAGEDFNWNPEGGIVGGHVFAGESISITGSGIHTLFHCVFIGAWDRIDLSNLTLYNCSFVDLDVDRFSCINTKFLLSSFEKAKLARMYIGGALFDSCDMEALYVREVIGGGNAPAEDMTVAFESASLINAHFVSGNLPFARFARSDLSEMEFGTVKLDNVQFPYCQLKNTVFTDAELTRNVSFKDVASLNGCHISRENLDALHDYGGLTVRQRRHLRVHDPIAKLRNEFSGFWSAVHIFSLICFLLPYATFLYRQYSKSVPSCDSHCETIAQRLAQFIYTGGHMNGEFNWSFAIFWVLLVYNLCRGLLLWKTKQLELVLTVTGVTPNFSMKGFWGVLFTFAKVGFWFNLVLVMAHSANFLMRYVLPTQ